MPHIPLMAVGGIHVGNTAEFLNSGCMSVGVGSHILDRNLVLNKEYRRMTETARQFVALAQQGAGRACEL